LVAGGLLLVVGPFWTSSLMEYTAPWE